MRFPAATWVVFLLLPLPLILVVLYVMLVRGDDPVLGLILIGGSLLFVLPVVVFLARVQHQVSRERIVTRGLFRSVESTWDSVQSAKWQSFHRQLVIESSCGKHRLSLYMHCLATVAERVLEQDVPIDEVTRAELQRWAEGNVRRLWSPVDWLE